jgi:SpoVK/Ycf46/Vps4 family AAA+-type ATPase
MNNPPKNKTNQNKNIFFFIKDLSNNNPFLDPSSNTTKNPLFSPLQSWNINKNLLLLNDKDNSNNDFKTKKDDFTMRLDSIIDKIREERKENSKNITSDNLFKLKTTLNNDQLLKNRKKVIFNPQLPPKDAIDDLLLQITKKYDLASGNNIKNKAIVPRLKPPLPPLPDFGPRFNHRRSSSIYIPPKKAWDTTPLPPPPPNIKKELKIINKEINGLKDLLELIEENPISPYIEYNINMRSMHNIKEPLGELDNMIGMNGLKDSIVDQIVYFVQNLHINKNAVNPDFMHTCIYGPPGTGKTEIAKIMGKIFSSLGVLNKKYFKKVTRADLIAGYLGQTAMKTRDVIKDALGGVLFIDEAYALGNPEKRDSFAKECIDTLCEGLSDHKDKLMVIIAGYEDDLKKCFFAYNQGLNSRFPWRFKTDDYKAGELNKIFQKKIIDAGWSLKDDIPDSWFEPKMETFKFYGRDMETLLSKTKIAHGRRVFCKPKDEKTKIVMKDIEKGYKMFIEVGDTKDADATKNILQHMYL